MHKLTIILCVVIASSSKQPQVRTSEVSDEYVNDANRLSVSLQAGEIEYGPPPPSWRKNVGRKFSFVGTYETYGKGFITQGVRVGEYLIDVRGGDWYEIMSKSKVRVTGVLQHVRHPGDPALANASQQGISGGRENPWHEWFFDVTKIEVISKPE
jgi:hypothetical protein